MLAVYPLLALRGLHVFPHTLLSFDAGRAYSMQAVDAALEGDRCLFLTAQRDMEDEDPSTAELCPYGTVALIRQVLKLPDGHARVLVEGIARGMITRRMDNSEYLAAEIARRDDPPEGDSPELDALHRAAQTIFEDFCRISTRVPDDAVEKLDAAESLSEYADVLAHNLLHRFEDKQRILELHDLSSRYDALLAALYRELEVARVERDIQKRVKKQLDKNQKEYVLREQIRAIRTELGEEGENEIADLRRRADKTPLSEEARTKVLKEIQRLEAMPPSSHEATVSRSWLDWVFALPWEKQEDPPIDITRARQVLDRDHYALERVKERVLEFLAVRALVGDSVKGPILCLVGPPGVGKTSIGRAIAEAMNRKFVRMSLGGVRDEAEIRGHRRTYIGAIPGRILTGLRQVSVNNPLVMLDEIDKLASDAQGDPAAALLEVLDGEQNHAFADHYL
ncbi:MAG: LON peptidase substrate-binding domain-containing protein, partial [Clostridia bacterium]|nr:LON peptidase substrate-binding domain-containing protein [Clostridia bacterium]